MRTNARVRLRVVRAAPAEGSRKRRHGNHMAPPTFLQTLRRLFRFEMALAGLSVWTSGRQQRARVPHTTQPKRSCFDGLAKTIIVACLPALVLCALLKRGVVDIRHLREVRRGGGRR